MIGEKWVYRYIPEMKQASMMRKEKKEQTPAKSKVRMISRQSSSDHTLGCGKHVTGGICGEGSETVNQETYILGYTHPTMAGNQYEATWQIAEYDSVHLRQCEITYCQIDSTSFQGFSVEVGCFWTSCSLPRPGGV